MITGVECAGLVLGAFPLLIAGLNLYSEGLKTIRGARGFVAILNQYGIDLDIEQAKFNDTWSRILQLGNSQALKKCNANVNFEELVKLGQGPSGLDLGTILSLSLHNCTDDVKKKIEVGMRELHRNLDQVTTDFGIERNSVPDTPGLKRLLKMLKTELNSEYRNEKLSQIRNRNTDLSTFVSGEYQAQILAAARSQIQQSAIKHRSHTAKAKLYNAVQKQASAIYRVLQENLSKACCGVPHATSLELEVRGATELALTNEDFDVELENRYWRFKFCFSFEHSLHQPEHSNLICDLELAGIGQLAELVSGNERETRLEEVIMPTSLENIRGPCKKKGISAISTNNVALGTRACGSFQMAQFACVSSADAPIPQAVVKLNPSSFKWPLKRKSVELDLRISKKFRQQSEVKTDDLPIRPKLPQTNSSLLQTPDVLPGAMNSKETEGNRSCVPNIIVSAPCDLQSSTQSQQSPKSRHRSCKACTFANDEVITCLCSAIRASASTKGQQPQDQRCVGLLTSVSKNGFRVCPRRGQGIILQCKQIISLQALLRDRNQREPSTLAKLKLGVILASSVMQLHESSWLKDAWSSADILFKRDSRGSAALHKPFVQGMLPLLEHDDNASMDDWSSIGLFCNVILLSLGVVLLEIHHWKCIDVLQGAMTKAQALRTLIPELFELAGANYAWAVKRCIQGLEHREIALSHEGFKNEVYQKIVFPLEENLKTFCGESDLQKIFEE
ncbi:hypothetical protein BDZ91DRAFT_728619 [Kalaharituber pfeilii]|nr:hypothetical protein BDZ91DRAFT_728619 [Kalaharituber pfeilii]